MKTRINRRFKEAESILASVFSLLLFVESVAANGNLLPMVQSANRSVANVPTTTIVTALPVNYPRDPRDFLVRSYQVDEFGSDDAFCTKLSLTCPFLTSRTARPTSTTSIRVRVRVDFMPTMFIGIDDLLQMFSVVGTFVFHWQLPRCAKWSIREDFNLTTTSTSTTATMMEMPIMMTSAMPVNQSTALPRLPVNRNVTECRFRKTEMWHPAIKHINAASKPDFFEMNGRDIVVTPDGKAHWEVSLRLDSSCKLSFKTYPFDRQRCSITIGQFSYPDFVFEAETIDEEQSQSVFDNLLKNTIWHLDDLTSNVYWQNLSITFDVTRISESYAGTIFIPTTLLSLLQMATVAMPPETTDRSAFSITGFVALAVFQSFFTSGIPHTSEILFLTIYYEVQMAIGVLITIYSLIICRIIGHYKQLAKPLNWHGCKVRLVDFIDLGIFLVSLGLFLTANLLFYYSSNRRF